MDTYSLDAEQFINEIATHPALWDLTSEDNKCSASKEKAWADVARTFISGYDGMSESKKLEVFRKLQSKWRNLRDNYVRFLRRKSSGQRAYTYAKNLAFLDPVYLNRPTRKHKGDRLRESNEFKFNDEPETEVNFNDDGGEKRRKSGVIKEETSSDDEPSVIENFKRRRREKSLEFLEVKTEGEIEIPSSSEQDEDKLFFDSLLPVVRQFDLDQKLELRTRILQLIKKIRSSSSLLNSI